MENSENSAKEKHPQVEKIAGVHAENLGGTAAESDLERRIREQTSAAHPEDNHPEVVPHIREKEEKHAHDIPGVHAENYGGTSAEDKTSGV